MDKVIHFEIPFDDKARAVKFYTEAFDWKLTDFPEMNYVVAQSADVDEEQRPKEPGAINGGLFKRPQDAPNPTIYVGVASIEDALEKVKIAGGRIVTPKTEIPTMGAYARVSDTEGNVIGLFEGG
jgi:uncharacterized protein